MTVLIILLISTAAEVLYILFRDMRINRMNPFFYSAAAVASAVIFLSKTSAVNLVSVITLITLLTASVKLKNPDFEKPRLSYLMILAAVLIFHFVK